MELLAATIDKLLWGDLPGVGDTLMQRFRVVHLAASQGWKVASELELSNRADASLVPMEMREEALKAYQRSSRVQEGLFKAKAGGGNR